LRNKQDMIDRLVASLKQLAKNRNMEDFDLNLDVLETMEGRKEM